MAIEYLDLQLRHELRVGIPAQAIAEVLSFKPGQISPVPGVNPLLLGVSNWRGKLLWSLNLSDLLALRAESEPSGGNVSLRGTEPLTAVVVADAMAQRTLACVVSKLRGIVEVPETQVQPMPAQFPEQLRQSFRGVTRLDTPMLLLDMERLFQIHRW